MSNIRKFREECEAKQKRIDAGEFDAEISQSMIEGVADGSISILHDIFDDIDIDYVERRLATGEWRLHVPAGLTPNDVIARLVHILNHPG